MSKKRLILGEIGFVLLAVLMAAVGFFYNNIAAYLTKATDPNALGAGDVGKTFTFKCEPYLIDTDGDALVIQYYTGDDGYGYYVSAPDGLKNELYNRCVNSAGTYQGVFRQIDDATRQKGFDAIDDYYIGLSEYMEDFDYANSPELQAEAHDSLAGYCIELVSLNDAPSKIPQGIAYALAAFSILLIFLRPIAFFTKASTFKVTVIAITPVLIIVLVLAAINFNKLRTVASIKKVDNGLYSMTFYGDLKTDKLLDADISTTGELVDWIIDEQLGGIPVEVDEANFGCATFSCTNPEGDVLFGRNFDYPDTDNVVIYTDPGDGYASYALADLTVLGLGETEIDPESPVGRAYMLATPYMCLDGVNEAGLAVGILELDINELHQDNGKPDLLIYSAIRPILDKCATVDEAVALLEAHDIHSSLDVSYHLQIVDKSGRSVVVEWLDGQIVVNELNAATNSVLTPGAHFDEGDPDERLGVLADTLDSTGCVMNEEQARDLLDSVSQEHFTEWSCVYNLDRFEVHVYIDEDYEHDHVFGGS